MKRDLSMIADNQRRHFATEKNAEVPATLEFRHLLRALLNAAMHNGRNNHAFAVPLCNVPELPRTAGHEALDERCRDNAPRESIQCLLKREALIGYKRFDSCKEAAAGVDRWPEICGTVRPHSTIGNTNPPTMMKSKSSCLELSERVPAMLEPSGPNSAPQPGRKNSLNIPAAVLQNIRAEKRRGANVQGVPAIARKQRDMPALLGL